MRKPQSTRSSRTAERECSYTDAGDDCGGTAFTDRWIAVVFKCGVDVADLFAGAAIEIGGDSGLATVEEQTVAVAPARLACGDGAGGDNACGCCCVRRCDAAVVARAAVGVVVHDIGFAAVCPIFIAVAETGLTGGDRTMPVIAIGRGNVWLGQAVVLAVAAVVHAMVQVDGTAIAVCAAAARPSCFAVGHALAFGAGR